MIAPAFLDLILLEFLRRWNAKSADSSGIRVSPGHFDFSLLKATRDLASRQGVDIYGDHIFPRLEGEGSKITGDTGERFGHARVWLKNISDNGESQLDFLVSRSDSEIEFPVAEKVTASKSKKNAAGGHAEIRGG